MTIKEKIIKFLGDYPEREFYAQEIAKKVGCSKSSASGILKSLTAEGVVFKSVKGHMKFYRINLENLEVKKTKINFALKRLKVILPKLKKLSQKIILFGSVSRGEQSFDSDIDLLVLTSNKEEVRKVLKQVSPRTKIQAIIKTPAEWSEMEIKEPEFYYEVKSGIALHDNVLRV